MSNPLLERLRHHVTGAIERGEAEAITEVKPQLLVDAFVNGRRIHLGKCEGTVEELRKMLAKDRRVTVEGTDSMGVTAVLVI